MGAIVSDAAQSDCGKKDKEDTGNNGNGKGGKVQEMEAKIEKQGTIIQQMEIAVSKGTMVAGFAGGIVSAVIVAIVVLAVTRLG